MTSSEYDYTERPKQFEREDFWRQVRRTINGVPVDESQISLIVGQISSALRLLPTDKLLDVGCGNGALSARLEPCVGELLGIDISKYLIEVASGYFCTPKMSFSKKGVEEVIGDPAFQKFNKGLLYGASSFLKDEVISKLVEWFFEKEADALMFGNVRDRSCAFQFYGFEPEVTVLDDVGSSMGKWRNQEWYEQLAERKGLKVQIFKMPEKFYAAKYYFDVLITRH